MKNGVLFIIVFCIISSCNSNSSKDPVASFSVSTNNPLVGQTVIFTNNSQYANTYFWDFGDNTNNTDISPTHSYSTPGNYSITLTATNGSGKSQISKTITVTSNTGVITGSVTPFGAAKAIIYSLLPAGQQNVLYNSTGNFTIPDLPAGSYSVSVVPQIGYTAIPAVQVTVTPGGTINTGVFNLPSNGQVASAKFTMDGTGFIFLYPQTSCNFTSGNLDIYGTSSNNQSYWYLKLALSNINGTGTYNLTGSSYIQMTHFISPGVSDGNWLTLNGGNNAFITITYLDNIAKIIAGNFTATLFPQGSTAGGNKQMTNGTFIFNF